MKGVSPIFNCILLALPPVVRDELLSQCDPVELASGQMIYAAGDPVEYNYFINSGLVSVVKIMEDGRSAQILAVGTEGLLGLWALYGIEHTFTDFVVQVPGLALRISRKTLQDAMSKHDALRRMMTQYFLLSAEQVIQHSACNRLHSLEQRCCFWLLVAHDNAFADQFKLTHESLASLLGAQRSSVSEVANVLQRRRMIRYSHGRISILDRAALERTVCECYRARCSRINQACGIWNKTPLETAKAKS